MVLRSIERESDRVNEESNYKDKILKGIKGPGSVLLKRKLEVWSSKARARALEVYLRSRGWILDLSSLLTFLLSR